jgi:hypothetical protein
MAKVFKFDAIGRDLFPGERQAAKAFVSKYESPPSKADTQKQMRTVMGRVLRTASTHVSPSTTLRQSISVDSGPRSKGVKGTTLSKESKVRVTGPFAAKASVKRSAKG